MLKLFVQTSDEREILSQLDKLIGTRLDLTQAGGGNISVKRDDTLLVKTSGTLLFDDIISVVDYKSLDKTNEEDEAVELRNHLISGMQPSLETWFHCVTRKYTIHCHPIAVIEALAKNEAEIEKRFDCQIVEYTKPGISLLKYIDEESPKIVFLKNHGLIVNSDDVNEALRLLNEVIDYCEDLIFADFSKYKLCTKLQRYFYEVYDEIDFVLPITFTPKVVSQTPDCVVYTNGTKYLEIKDIESLKNYTERFHLKPVIVKLGDYWYSIASSYIKCHFIEDVLRMYSCLDGVKALTVKEIEKLLNWESEKIRKE